MRSINIKQRNKQRRKAKPVYLVIAEGKNKTETIYLSHFQSQGAEYSLRFAKAGTKTDAESLYKAMELKWKELELSEEKGDIGFIILDIDNDPQKAEKVRSLIKSNRNPSIRFVVSNPTFEIWLLFHFKYTTKQFENGNEVIRELRKHILNYEKTLDCFEICKEKQTEAINNAAKVEKHFENCDWPSAKCNPRTDVGGLVKLLAEAVTEL